MATLYVTSVDIHVPVCDDGVIDERAVAKEL